MYQKWWRDWLLETWWKSRPSYYLNRNDAMEHSSFALLSTYELGNQEDARLRWLSIQVDTKNYLTYFLRLLAVAALLIPAKKHSEIEAIQGESTIFQVHSCMHNGEKWMTQNKVHGHSTVKSKYCHILSPCGWHPPCPTLSACAELSPTDIAGSNISVRKVP